MKRCVSGLTHPLFLTMDMMLKVALLACGLVLLAPGCWMVSPIPVCESGWFHIGDSCWLVTTESMPWCQAMAYCGMLGARLAYPNSQDENKFASDLIPKAVGKGWLGVLCYDKRCLPIHSAKILDFANWDDNQPDNFNGIPENCVALHHTGRWHDYSCCKDERMAAICRKDLTK